MSPFSRLLRWPTRLMRTIGAFFVDAPLTSITLSPSPAARTDRYQA